MKARLEILESSLISDLKLLLDRGILDHDEAPVLPVAAAWRAELRLRGFRG